MRNGYDVLISKTCRLEDTMYRHHLLKQDADHIHLQYQIKKRSATNIFRSLDMLIARMFLVLYSIATHNHMIPEPTLS